MQARIDGQLTEEICIGTGISQGDSLSPPLFNLIMNEKGSENYKIRNEEIETSEMQTTLS